MISIHDESYLVQSEIDILTHFTLHVTNWFQSGQIDILCDV
jgi:hypothetical protein